MLLQDFHYWKRRTEGVRDVHDANNLERLISLVVNNDELLTTGRIVLFNSVDCSWYKNADGTDFQRPIRMMFGIGTLAALAIVGADNHGPCTFTYCGSVNFGKKYFVRNYSHLFQALWYDFCEDNATEFLAKCFASTHKGCWSELSKQIKGRFNLTTIVRIDAISDCEMTYLIDHKRGHIIV